MANMTSAVMIGRSIKMRERFIEAFASGLQRFRIHLAGRNGANPRAREQPQLAVGDYALARAETLGNRDFVAEIRSYGNRPGFHRLILLYDVNHLAIGARLHSFGGRHHRLPNGPQRHGYVRELAWEKLALAVVKRGFQVNGAGV